MCDFFCMYTYACAIQQSYDILLLILMVLLLVQAILTSATVVHCASYKSQLRMGAPECEDSMHPLTHYYEVTLIKAGVVETNGQIYVYIAHFLVIFVCIILCLTLNSPAIAHVNGILVWQHKNQWASHMKRGIVLDMLHLFQCFCYCSPCTFCVSHPTFFCFISLRSKHPLERRISTKTEPGRLSWSKWPSERYNSTGRSVTRTGKTVSCKHKNSSRDISTGKRKNERWEQTRES